MIKFFPRQPLIMKTPDVTNGDTNSDILPGQFRMRFYEIVCLFQISVIPAKMHAAPAGTAENQYHSFFGTDIFGRIYAVRRHSRLVNPLCKQSKTLALPFFYFLPDGCQNAHLLPFLFFRQIQLNYFLLFVNFYFKYEKRPSKTTF